MFKTQITYMVNIPKRLGLFLISAYQALLSPDHSWLKARYPYGYCRHYPSCSEYSKQAIESKGLIKGVWLGVKRISRCNPWTEPTIDLISN